MARYVKGKNGKFAGSIGNGKHRLPKEIRPVSHSAWGAFLENRTIRKITDQAAQFVLETVSAKYDHVDRWKMADGYTIPGINDRDLEQMASHTKAKHLVDDWYAACRKRKLEPMTPFADIPKGTREEMAYEMLYTHYRKAGAPYVGGM